MSISTQRVVFHTLALVESIDIGSFTEAGPPQAMPPSVRGMSVSKTPLPKGCGDIYHPLAVVVTMARGAGASHFGRPFCGPGMSGSGLPGFS